MTTENKVLLGLLTLVVGLFIFVTTVMVGHAIQRGHKQVEQPVRVYYMKYGGMYCGRMERYPCGIRLSQCTDTRIYECLQDVAYEDEDEKPSR
jgi:hypothetical protein